MTTPTTNKRQIIKLIGSDKLELVKGDGYWYFVYDDFQAKGLYETSNVNVFLLNHLSVEYWVQLGKDFVKEMENPI